MLLEGVGTVERLTSSVHRLHIVLLKVCYLNWQMQLFYHGKKIFRKQCMI